MSEEIFTPIRCPETREHGKYTLCGRLLGAVKDGKLYVYCEHCKQFYRVDILENDVLEMTRLPKNERLKFKPSLKILF